MFAFILKSLTVEKIYFDKSKQNMWLQTCRDMSNYRGFYLRKKEAGGTSP